MVSALLPAHYMEVNAMNLFGKRPPPEDHAELIESTQRRVDQRLAELPEPRTIKICPVCLGSDLSRHRERVKVPWLENLWFDHPAHYFNTEYGYMLRIDCMCGRGVAYERCANWEPKL